MSRTNVSIFVAVLLILAIVVVNVNTNKSFEGSEVTSFVIKSSLDGDFPVLDQGTYTYKGNLKKELDKNNYSVMPDYVILFYSRKIPGLAMKYNLNDKTIEAGLPIIKSPPLELLDNNSYNIAYSFNDKGLQKVFVNCKEIISSPYTGSVGSMITGFSSYEFENMQEVDLDVEIGFHKKILNEDTLP
jgi:hypothetical protein